MDAVNSSFDTPAHPSFANHLGIRRVILNGFEFHMSYPAGMHRRGQTPRPAHPYVQTLASNFGCLCDDGDNLVTKLKVMKGNDIDHSLARHQLVPHVNELLLGASMNEVDNVSHF